jgi:hypothetical protein
VVAEGGGSETKKFVPLIISDLIFLFYGKLFALKTA